jgi:hypothetical protein
LGLGHFCKTLRCFRQTGVAGRVGSESRKRSHRQHRLLIPKGLRQAELASFGFVLTHFSGRFIDSIVLSGFVLQNFRFFFSAFGEIFVEVAAAGRIRGNARSFQRLLA